MRQNMRMPRRGQSRISSDSAHATILNCSDPDRGWPQALFLELLAAT